MKLTTSMVLRRIGWVRSEIRDPKAMPSGGVPATIEVLPEYADGLLRLEKHSHVWVIAWLDEAERHILQVTPKGATDPGPEGVHGVFAVRSPARPNPIGLTSTRILGIRRFSLEVDLLDFVDGTSVVDIKPYFANRDIIFSATSGRVACPGTREIMRTSLLREAVNFHGESCADLTLAVRVVEHFRFEVLQLMEPLRWKVTVPLQRPCLVDAFMGMTRATPGRGSLLFHHAKSVRFEHDGSVWVYALWPSPGDAVEEPDPLLRVSLRKS